MERINFDKKETEQRDDTLVNKAAQALIDDFSRN